MCRMRYSGRLFTTTMLCFACRRKAERIQAVPIAIAYVLATSAEYIGITMPSHYRINSYPSRYGSVRTSMRL
jgi:hypothetical protein